MRASVDPADARRPRRPTTTATPSSSRTRTAARSSWRRSVDAASTRPPPTPGWMARRIQLAGMRPISLAVDVTNYVMLELGQPIHGYDRDRLAGPIVVRRATRGREAHHPRRRRPRTLSAEDLARSPTTPGRSASAGVMGGETTEMSRDHHRRPHRGRPLGPGLDLPHRAPPQAALRGGQALRARRRPHHLRGRGRPGRRAAGRATAAARSSRASPWSATPPARAGDRGRRRPARPGHRHGDRPPTTAVAHLRAVGCEVDERRRRLTVTPPPVAPRPHRPLRPGRGGRPDRRLRQRALGAAAAPRPAAGSPAPAAAPPGRPHAGRGRASSRWSASRSSATPDLDALGLRRRRPAPHAAAAGQPALRPRSRR